MDCAVCHIYESFYMYPFVMLSGTVCVSFVIIIDLVVCDVHFVGYVGRIFRTDHLLLDRQRICNSYYQISAPVAYLLLMYFTCLQIECQYISSRNTQSPPTLTRGHPGSRQQQPVSFLLSLAWLVQTTSNRKQKRKNVCERVRYLHQILWIETSAGRQFLIDYISLLAGSFLSFFFFCAFNSRTQTF